MEKRIESDGKLPQRDKPWLMRTYSGHSSAEASNALYRTNLEKGQTGLSVAFDLPTQTGYDADHRLAAGEVGKVGVPISHLGDMNALFAQLPLDRLNTSMTINATAPWLLALYIALAEKRGVEVNKLQGTTQNDIVKEYLSRGTYIFPPQPSMRLTTDLITHCAEHLPKFNPINVCSYHLQEAGAQPVQEIAYTLSTAMAVLDAVKESGRVSEELFPTVFGRISFFVNAGIRFVEELCKLRALDRMWDEIGRVRYGVEDPKLRRFRYGVQVNSLGLTEPQPENNVQRIVLEMLSTVLSRDARARAVQLPAWNEAIGLPRPWDQQWSLRIQQVLAYETDLLEYSDLFEGSKVVEAKTNALIEAAKGEMKRIDENGGMLAGLESGSLKSALVAGQAARVASIEKGDTVVVGVNRFVETSTSPLTQGSDGGVFRVDPESERKQIERLNAHRNSRNASEVKQALENLSTSARSGSDLMKSSIACAHAGVTTGEWADALREVFGDYRARTGVDAAVTSKKLDVLPVRLIEQVRQTSEELGRPIKILIAKPGLDGHSNGAEQIAVRARQVGMEVVYEGIRKTTDQIASAALEESVHLVGVSVLSGSHLDLTRRLLTAMDERGIGDIPMVVGGIIPEADRQPLLDLGVAAVYTPKDNDLNRLMADLMNLARKSSGLAPLGEAL